MILGIEHAAAVLKGPKLAEYLIRLDEAKQTALGLGMAEHAAQIDQLIRSTQIACQDNQAVIEMYERQESGRQMTRALSAYARDRIGEQLLFIPRPHAVGAL